MELHQLRYVVALARTGNFSRAATQAHVSQPSLSQQIQKLELELGQQLFDRHRNRTRLTKYGERFLIRAERVLHELEETVREARESHPLHEGEVVMGVLPTIAPYFVPRAVAAFGEKYPGISITILEETTEVLLELLGRHEIDFALASLPMPGDQLIINTLLTEELLLAVPQEHPLATKTSVTQEDLSQAHFVLMKEGHCLGDQVLRFCEKNDFQPKVRSRSAQIETILALVEAGQGVSLIPAMARQRSTQKAVVYRSLNAPRPERAIVTVWRKRRPPNRAADEFLTQLRGLLQKTDTHSSGTEPSIPVG